MFRHKQEHGPEWVPVAGTVVQSRKHGRDWTYVIEYRLAAGEAFRVTVPALDGHNIELPPGTPVQIETDGTSGAARLVAGQPLGAGAPSLRDAVNLARGLQGHGDRGAAVAAALAGLGQAGAGEIGVVGNAGVGITGGPEVRVVGGAQAAEVMEAVQELMRGGDPAAARERIQHLKAGLLAQSGVAAPGPAAAAEPESFTSAGPSTFDSVASPPPVTPATFSSPDPSAGQPGPDFGQPGFSAVAPATTFSSPESPGSFNAGSATGSGAFGGFGETRSDRIARLEDQRDRGQITPEQFAAQRQHIQDEF